MTIPHQANNNPHYQLPFLPLYPLYPLKYLPLPKSQNPIPNSLHLSFLIGSNATCDLSPVMYCEEEGIYDLRSDQWAPRRRCWGARERETGCLGGHHSPELY